ncbi:zf-HC2 domain-containing protein [Saccharopolyspora cebuensis]|uniref:Zf-HC2 domain-containing protein n=1 Tax=Saccharopolyspora cebuensis TaxID=418759 RepID=A0ABV4CL03_9PSEU
MTVLRGWSLPEQHLALEAIVAFVDGELGPSARDRASAHLAGCPACASDAAAQRQARAAVQAAGTPSVSPSLLQALQSIPSHAEIPAQPDGLALTEDGQLVAMSRPNRARFGTGPVLGSSRPLGGSQQPLGSSVRGTLGGSRPLGDPAALGESPEDAAPPRESRGVGRRTRQGAGVVFSGLVLGALAFMNLPTSEEDWPQDTTAPPLPGGGGSGVIPASVAGTLPAEPAPSADASAVPEPLLSTSASPTPLATSPAAAPLP